MFLLLSRLITLKSSFVITGDFNLHMDAVGHSHIDAFNEVLENFNLIQHVTGPTHTADHTLDLLITNEDSPFKTTVQITDCLSDHFSITASLNFEITSVPPKQISYRPIRKIDITKFRSDLAESELLTNPASTTSSSLYSQYHSVLSALLDLHAPLKTRVCLRVRVTHG